MFLFVDLVSCPFCDFVMELSFFISDGALGLTPDGDDGYGVFLHCTYLYVVMCYVNKCVTFSCLPLIRFFCAGVNIIWMCHVHVSVYFSYLG